MSNELTAPDFAIPPDRRVYITRHLPICRNCDELCFTPQCTQAMYDEWLARHQGLGHTIEHGPEWPPPDVRQKRITGSNLL